MKIKQAGQEPQDHTLLETARRPYFAVPTALFVEDLETRMRNVLEYLTTEDGVSDEGVLEGIFMDDFASDTIEAGATLPEDLDYFDIHEKLADELGI